MGDIKAMLNKKLFHVRAHTTPCRNVFWENSEFTNGPFAGPERSESKGSESDLVTVMCHSSPSSLRAGPHGNRLQPGSS